MVRKSRINRIIKSETGGIGAIIAMVVSIILVLGLIAYTVLGQVAGAKDTGDRAQLEQDKINQMLQDPSIVTGNVVKNYFIQQSHGGCSVTISLIGGKLNIGEADIIDGALFTEDKQYDANGKLAKVDFVQVNLSR